MRGARAIAAPAFALALACMPAAHAAGYVCHGVEPGRIRLEGEVGRRIAATITNNFLKLDVARDFLPAFRRKGVSRKKFKFFRCRRNPCKHGVPRNGS